MSNTRQEMQRWLYVPLDTAGDEHSQQLLNLLLLTTTTIVILMLSMNVVADALGRIDNRGELTRMYTASIAVLLGNGIISVLNHRSSKLARWPFVLLVFVAAVLGNSPQHVASGRNVIALTIPVVAASLLIHPAMSFIVAGLGCLTIKAIAHSLGMLAPTSLMTVLFLVAFIVAILVYAWERTQISWRTTNKNMALLNQASQALSSTLDLDQVLLTVLDEVRRLLGVMASSVWLIDSETGELVCWQATEPQGEIVRGWRLAPGEGLAGWVAHAGESLIVPDIRTDERYYKGVDQSTGLNIRSVVSVPLRVRENVTGVLQVVDVNVNCFKPADLELLEPLAATAAISIENARLYAEEQQRAIALSQALDQQQELDRLKDEFLQNISHELRTPLALILGYAELMNSGELGELTLDQKRPVAIIARRVRMLSKMVNNLIAILTVEAQELRKDTVDLADLVRSMLVDFRVATEEAELSLIADVSPGLPSISGDPDQLRRVLDNLLSNALKFTPAGGRLTVRLWHDRDAEVVILDVSDTGIGIPQDQLDRVFDRFYQIDGSSKRRYGGVGLGLALVKEIVQAHGGQISVWSIVDKGSTFRITLPATATC
ncbi:MAG: GAF domain-containing protein [Chloroflexi bacterium]|nr:GAF domain-containing protein [Chloroflexota bacterium]